MWELNEKAWSTYTKLEEWDGEHYCAPAIYERWIAVCPDLWGWDKWSEFEEEGGRIDKASTVFQATLELFGDDWQQAEAAQVVVLLRLSSARLWLSLDLELCLTAPEPWLRFGYGFSHSLLS